jgi:hypothetical protein
MRLISAPTAPLSAVALTIGIGHQWAHSIGSRMLHERWPVHVRKRSIAMGPIISSVTPRTKTCNCGFYSAALVGQLGITNDKGCAALILVARLRRLAPGAPPMDVDGYKTSKVKGEIMRNRLPLIAVILLVVSASGHSQTASQNR